MSFNINNLLKPQYITLAEYQGLGVKDSKTLYFIKGTSLIYKGAELYGASTEKVTELPIPSAAIRDLMYIIQSGVNSGFYVLNAAGDGFDRIGVSAEYITSVMADTFTNVEYNGINGELKFTQADGTNVAVNIPVDNFLSAANFDADSNVLTLTLTNGTEYEIDLKDLMDVYKAGSTNSVQLNLAPDGTFTADIKVSSAADNIVEIKADGVYVKKTPIATAATISASSTDNEAASAKLLHDALERMSWNEM